MDFNDASHDISKKYPTLSTSDIRNMMDDEIREEESRRDNSNRGGHRYERAVATAHERILQWIATADEYQVNDVASFVASHRRACVWAVLVGQRLSKETAQRSQRVGAATEAADQQ